MKRDVAFRLLLVVFAWLPGLIPALAQQESGGRIIASNVADFETDNLGNLFIISSNGRVKKLDARGDSVGVYNLVRQFGDLYSVDVSNPLKVLLFYRDFATVVVLDRFLNDRNILDLRRTDILQPSAIAQSFDNNIWVWDDLESRVLKVSDEGTLLLESPDLRVTFDEPPHPNILVDYNRYLYAYDSLRGILVMDYYGAYKSLVAYPGWRHVHQAGKGIVGFAQGKLWYYTPGFPDARSITLPVVLPAQVIKIRLSGKSLYVLAADGTLTKDNLALPD